jgi:ATP-binding cassette, subfamily B, bacterial CvaB/MchF/RaxB
MSISSSLSFRFSARPPLILQTETTECGLACLGMIANYYGNQIDLPALRAKFVVSLQGTTLAQLIEYAGALKLNARPLSLQLDEIGHLRLPCILHWDFEHFVVLERVSRRGLHVLDPASARHRLDYTAASKLFTGVALELWPAPDFRPKRNLQRLELRSLIGKTSGIGKALVQVTVIALLIELCSLLFPFFTQWVVDDVIVSNDRDLLTTIVLGFIILLLFQQMATAARSWILMFLENSLKVEWSCNVFAHLTRLPLEFFARRYIGDIVSRFGSIEQIQRTITTSFVTGILDGVMSIATLVMMFVYNVRLSLIGVAALLVYIGIRWARYGALRSAMEGQLVAAAKQQSHFLESIRGRKTSRLFQREDCRRTKWQSLLVRQTNAGIRAQRAQLLYDSTRGVLSGIERLWVLWLGARIVLDGNLTIGALMAFIAYKDQFDARVLLLIDKCFEWKILRLQGNRLADIVLCKPEDTKGRAAHAMESMDIPEIEFKRLFFRYTNHDPFVLSNINLTIAPGECIAITGPSGGGKTTLAQLLLGVSIPTKGQILIGGVGLRTLGAGAVRRITGSVTQDDVLFAGSILENITFFDPDPNFTRVKECAELAVIDKDIDKMPMKYRTLVGDMGTVLSGGQKQRILLARALYKRPKIILLDEATSHMDPEVESRFLTHIRSLDLTRIIIAHRRETLACADRVVHIIDGTIGSNAPASKGDRLLGETGGNRIEISGAAGHHVST